MTDPGFYLFSLYGFLLLTVVYFNVRTKIEHTQIQYKLFMALVSSDIILIIMDVLSCAANGVSYIPSAYFILIFVLGYAFNFLPSIFWLAYVDYQIHQDKRRVMRIFAWLALPFIVNAAISVISYFTGWYFYIDASGIYHRGPLMPLNVVFSYVVFAASVTITFIYRKKVEKRHLFTLLFFPVPLLIANIFQLLYQDTILTWNFMTLSLLLVHINMQDRTSSTDYLTGLYNRRLIDHRIRQKIRNCGDGRSFSIMLIDLNHLKVINDTLGHGTGDDAIKDMAYILVKSLRSNDFIARYGGDEFLIILDIDDPAALKETAERIKAIARAFNAQSGRPYAIEFGIGYDVYDCSTMMRPADFIKHVDRLMYLDKEENDASGEQISWEV